MGTHLSAAQLLAQKSFGAPGDKPAPAKSVRSQKSFTSSGIATVEVDYRTGRVTAVRISKSSGSPILDDAAVNGLRKAKFKPATISPVKMPFTFTLTGVDPRLSSDKAPASPGGRQRK